MTKATRRVFLRRALGTAATSVLQTAAIGRLLGKPEEGELLGLVPFVGEAREAVGRIEGEGLNGRLA